MQVNYPFILLGTVTVLYALASMGYLVNKNYSQALILSGYMIANIGLLMVGKSV